MEAYPPPAKGAREARLPSHQATVTTTARLHLGFLDPSGRGPRPFGSFGLSLDRPRTRLTLRRSQTLEVSGPESERARRYLKAVAASFRFPKAYALNVEQAIPPHAGLGSGTQLALAVGSAFAALGGLRLDAQDVAARLGRGARSGIGIATFALGGVVLDGGPRTDALPQLVSRLPFPSAWRVLLILDPRAQGLAGAGETAAFDQLPDFPESETEELYQRIQQGALPALAVSDFAGFCAQVGYLQAVMGRYFGPLQGGPYTSPAVSSVLEWLRGQGFTGIGQSSWGPTGFAFVPSQASGEALLGAVKARAHESGLSFDLAEGRNEAPSSRRQRAKFANAASRERLSAALRCGKAWAASSREMDAPMANPRILHMLTPLKHMSPFDVNMGLDAGFDHAIPYTNVTIEDVYGLVQDAIFSRGPEGIKRTGMFIGGKRAIEALDMMDRAKKAMVPPFEISVFADPAGSFTTAAAMVACAKKALSGKFSLDLKGLRAIVFGGTGVVAFASAVIAVSDGARATLVGYDGPERVKKLALESNARFDMTLDYADGSTEEQKAALVREADIIFAAGPAGRRLLTTDQLKEAKKLRVAADVNAVPPSGVEGVGVNDNGKPIPGTTAVGIGALAIGNIKYKTEFGLFKMMIEAEKPLYLDFRDAYDLAQKLVG